jgi:regulator of RNase E activity RraA
MAPPDADKFEQIRHELFTAVVGDVMDAAGLTSQFLPPELRPLLPEMVVVGRAMPVLNADAANTYVAHRGVHEPFGLMLEALDDLRPGEVYLCTGGMSQYALWGGLMTGRAERLGATGAVLDGYSRDTREIATSHAFPVFSHGSYGQDQGVRGRVIDYRCTVRFRNGAEVRPGDLVFGDVDGVLVVPQDFEDDILSAALKKVHGENLVRSAIENGASAKEAFDRYGVM